MANLSALQATYDQIYNPSINALTSQYKTQLGTAQAAKAAIPKQYDAQRAANSLSADQARLALPEELGNQGYAPNSGLAYSSGVKIGQAFGKNLNAIGTAQNNSLNTAQQGIDTLTGNYQNNLNTLKSNEQKDVQNAFATEQNNEATLAEKQASDAAANQTALYKAQLSANVAAGLNPDGTPLKGGGKTLTPEQIASNAMSANGSYTLVPQKDTTGKIAVDAHGVPITAKTLNIIGAYNNITAGLKANGIDPNSQAGQRAYASQGITKDAYIDATSMNDPKYQAVNTVVNNYWHNNTATKSTSSAETKSRITAYINQQLNAKVINEDQADALATKYKLNQ